VHDTTDRPEVAVGVIVYLLMRVRRAGAAPTKTGALVSSPATSSATVRAGHRLD
jgi:hypothetical protein